MFAQTPDNPAESVAREHDDFLSHLTRIRAAHAGRWVVWLGGLRGAFDDEDGAERWALRHLGVSAAFVIARAEAPRPVALSGIAPLLSPRPVSFEDLTAPLRSADFDAAVRASADATLAAHLAASYPAVAALAAAMRFSTTYSALTLDRVEALADAPTDPRHEHPAASELLGLLLAVVAGAPRWSAEAARRVLAAPHAGHAGSFARDVLAGNDATRR